MTEYIPVGKIDRDGLELSLTCENLSINLMSGASCSEDMMGAECPYPCSEFRCDSICLEPDDIKKYKTKG
jgi:hypothetical protein